MINIPDETELGSVGWLKSTLLMSKKKNPMTTNKIKGTNLNITTKLLNMIDCLIPIRFITVIKKLYLQ